MENLAWENADRSASERFPSDPRTHISPIIVHRALFFEKKGGGKAGWWKDGVPDVGESTRFSRARDDFGDTPDVPRDDEPSARGFGDASDAVSYTHLDVYKRQALPVVSNGEGVFGVGARPVWRDAGAGRLRSACFAKFCPLKGLVLLIG